MRRDRIRVTLLCAKGRAPNRIQKILRDILKRHELPTKGSCVYVLENGSFATVLSGIVSSDGAGRSLAIGINREFHEAVARERTRR